MNRSALVLAAALVFISSPLFAQRAAKPPVAAAVVSTEVVNLNSATAAQIALLPGIGPKTADLVVQYRVKNGPFKKIEDILENPRSGPVLLSVSYFSADGAVSRSIQKPQEISP